MCYLPSSCPRRGAPRVCSGGPESASASPFQPVENSWRLDSMRRRGASAAFARNPELQIGFGTLCELILGGWPQRDVKDSCRGRQQEPREGEGGQGPRNFGPRPLRATRAYIHKLPINRILWPYSYIPHSYPLKGQLCRILKINPARPQLVITLKH